MINKENGFALNIHWNFQGFRKNAFAFISLFVLLLLIYGNSVHCDWQFLRKEPKNIIALLASLELYHLQGEKEKLRSTIGQFLYLSRNGDILDMIKTNKGGNISYTPDPKKFLPILKNAFLQLADDSTRSMRVELFRTKEKGKP